MTAGRQPDDRRRTPTEREDVVEPHPERDDQPEAPTGIRGMVIAVAVVGGALLLVVVVHLIGGGFAPHGP